MLASDSPFDAKFAVLVVESVDGSAVVVVSVTDGVVLCSTLGSSDVAGVLGVGEIDVGVGLGCAGSASRAAIAASIFAAMIGNRSV